MTLAEIETWLREEDAGRLERLWAMADGVRRQHVGDAVHLRGLVELSNHCRRQCAYCGIRAGRNELVRYRLTETEIMDCVRLAASLGLGTVVLQAGEDPGLTRDGVAGLVRRIKAETALAVTLSLGERSDDELAAWREAGADRYLLRFETSNPELYRRIHPARPGETRDRLTLLESLRRLGYEVGSGVMVGIPGQTYRDLARDIERLGELRLDMIGLGPYLPHPETPLGRAGQTVMDAAADQVPNSAVMATKAMALARLVCPDANIPATTALATIDRARGHALGLQRGANVIMPDLTPPGYRELYAIYPGKTPLTADRIEAVRAIQALVASLSRSVGRGPGGARHREDVTSRPKECPSWSK